MVLGNIAILLGSGYLGTILTSDEGSKVPILGGLLSGAAKFVSQDGKEASSNNDQHTAQLMLQVDRLREDLRRHLGCREVTVVTTRSSGPGALTITAVVAAGVIGYAYIRWKGWKVSDFMWVTKRGLSDACNVVGNQLTEVSDSVHVAKKHLSGRIDRVDASLDEAQEIIEGTRDEVAIIHEDLSTFQRELQEVNHTVQIWGSRLSSIEDTQDRTVRATEALVGFGQQMEHDQNANIRQVSSFLPAPGPSEQNSKRLPPPPPLAVPTVPSVAKSKPTAEESQEKHGASPEASMRWKLPGLSFLRTSSNI